MKYWKRIFAVIITAIIALWPVSVLAIDSPDTLVINNNWAYRHLLETGDQLYLIDFTVEYTVNPTVDINSAFLARVLDAGGAELRSVAPYAYFDEGYDRGVIGIYFSAADAPAWSGAYTVEIIGNPVLAWSGAIPDVTQAVTNWSASSSMALTSTELSIRVLSLAQQLETDWPLDLIESAGGGGNQLTSYGETYFTSVIYELATICPTIFSIQEYEPSFPSKTFSQTYAADLADDVVGTPLDMSDLATAFGISTMWASGILFAIVCVVLLILIGRGTGSTKGAVAFTVPMIIVGALLGVIPLATAIVMGFLALAATLWIILGSKASA